MKSAWLIRFKNGYKVILSEKAYLKYDKETPKKDVDVEEHWFSMEKCIEDNSDADLVEQDNVQGINKKYRYYMVSWQDKEGCDYCKLFKIEQTVNRPNNPDNEEIIMDYMKINYGSSIKHSKVSIDYADEKITIGEDYAIEV